MCIDVGLHGKQILKHNMAVNIGLAMAEVAGELPLALKILSL